MLADSLPKGWGRLPDSSRRILLQLLRFGPASRTQLTTALGLSPASLSRMVVPLLRAGLVIEGRPQYGRSGGSSDGERETQGRPSIPLEAVPGAGLLVGVALTHAEVTVVVTDLTARVLASRTCPVAARSGVVDLDRAVADIAALVAELRTELTEVPGELIAVGVSMGGNVPDGRTVQRAPFLGWEDVPLADLLEHATGLPVRLENDLAALARAELWFGLGLASDRFIVVTIGIGVGYSLVVDRRVVVDADSGHGSMVGPLLDGLPQFNELEPGASGLEEAAHRLGCLIGQASAFTFPQRALVAGESAHLLRGHEDALARGVAEYRHPLARELPVEIHETGFDFWARGAAVEALSWVFGES